MNATQQHALSIVVEDRIRDLHNYRAWFRASPIMRRALGPLEVEYRMELRSLITLKWRARGIARAARQAEVARTAAVDAGVDYHIEVLTRDADGFTAVIR